MDETPQKKPRTTRAKPLTDDEIRAAMPPDLPPILSPKELARLLGLSVNQVLQNSATIRLPVLATLALTEMRASECCHLKPQDVDLDAGWIHVFSRPGFETKTSQSWKVPIHPRLRQILEQIPKGQREWFFTALPSPRYPAVGHHLNMKHVCEDFKKVLKQLGIPVGKKNGGFTLHSLRSSFKIICIHAGLRHEVVDAWQNHARRPPTASDA